MQDSDAATFDLANRFFLLRHGQSIANRQGLIVSLAATGVDAFGLSEHGAEEVRASIEANQNRLTDIERIYSSDFLRARETAEIAAGMLGASVELATRLRERGFGDWDGQSNEHYDRVWRADAIDPGHQRDQVESVESVARRMIEQIRDIDRSASGKTFLIVSHGDPLQILITATLRRDLRQHRDIDPIATAEIRMLERP